MAFASLGSDGTGLGRLRFAWLGRDGVGSPSLCLARIGRGGFAFASLGSDRIGSDRIGWASALRGALPLDKGLSADSNVALQTSSRSFHVPG